MKGSPMKRNFGIGASPMKNKPEEKVVQTRDATSITRSKGKESSTYKMDTTKTKINKDGSKTYTFTNDLGNSIKEVHSSKPSSTITKS